MKIKKSLLALVVALTLVCGLVIGANAAGVSQQIQAYLRPDITVKYDGEVRALKDANGNTVLPISYNGTTYIPIRAVGNLLDIGVDWDGATKTVLLGNSADGTDLIETFVPYTDYTKTPGYGGSLIPEFLQSSQKKTVNIGGETVSHWIDLRIPNSPYGDSRYACSFNLGGKYSELTFKVYCGRNITIVVTGDNDSVLGRYDVKGGQVPQTITLDLKNTTQLTFSYERVAMENYYGTPSNYVDAYIFSTVLK